MNSLQKKVFHLLNTHPVLNDFMYRLLKNKDLSSINADWILATLYKNKLIDESDLKEYSALSFFESFSDKEIYKRLRTAARIVEERL